MPIDFSLGYRFPKYNDTISQYFGPVKYMFRNILFIYMYVMNFKNTMERLCIICTIERDTSDNILYPHGMGKYGVSYSVYKKLFIYLSIASLA